MLDLDETLIYYPDEEMNDFETNGLSKLQIRPLARKFIQKLSKYYEIGIFTAAS